MIIRGVGGVSLGVSRGIRSSFVFLLPRVGIARINGSCSLKAFIRSGSVLSAASAGKEPSSCRGLFSHQMLCSNDCGDEKNNGI